MNALPLCYLSASLLLLCNTRLCITLCAGYFRTWPVRLYIYILYTDGRRTRVAGLHVGGYTFALARVLHMHEEHGVGGVYKRPYAPIYMRTYTYRHTRLHVDRCTCPCSARASRSGAQPIRAPRPGGRFFPKKISRCLRNLASSFFFCSFVLRFSHRALLEETES